MATENPTLEDSLAFLVALFKALFPDADVSALSFNYLWAKTQAAGVTDNHAHIEAVKNDLLPDTSEGDMLDRWGAVRGVTRKGATSARKADALRVTGVATTTVSDASELFHSSGLRFKTSGSDIVGPGGYVDVDVVAIDTGSATRLSKGERLTFSTPIANIEEDAELQLDMDEDGDDQELDGAYRLRILSRFSSPPLGGAQEDYVQWALEEVGIENAYAYPLRNGLGTVDVAALHKGSGTARLLSSPEIAELQAIIDTKRPVSVKGFRVLEVTTAAVNVEFTLLPDGQPQHEFDWDDDTPPTVLTWTALTRTVQLTAARPSTMKAGDRVIFDNVGDTGTGKERVIESLSGSDSFVLEDDPTGDTPSATDTVYSGGPLVELTRQAIQDHFDTLGTANPDASRYGAWEGNLRASAINREASAVDGVLDGTVVAPVGTIEGDDPAYPNNDSIELLIAGRILVRRQH